MKFSIEKDSFQKELSSAIKFTSSGLSSLPSLQGVYLELKDKKLIIKSTNLNDFYTTQISVVEEGSFETVFDAKKALEFLNILPSGNLTVTLEKSGLILSLGTLQGEFGIFQLDDYPTFPEIKQADEIVLTDAMVKMLPLVLFSASKDDARPVLTGILIESKDGVVRFVTTDGFRLSISSHDNSNEADWSFIASSKFLQELLSFHDGKELKLSYSKNDKVFSSEFSSTKLISRTIEGDFPPYQKVIPVKNTTSLTLDTQSFSKNIKAVSIFARESANIVVLDIQKDSMTIKPKGQKGVNSYAVQEITKFEGVYEIHDLHVWTLTSNVFAMSVHVKITQESVPQTNSLLRKINEIMKEKFGINHCTIQIEHDMINPDKK